jgi:hypothetical protein
MKIKSAVLMCHPSTPTNEMMADASPMADIMAEMNERRASRERGFSLPTVSVFSC